MEEQRKLSDSLGNYSSFDENNIPANADVQALTKILNKMISFSSTLDNLYSDACTELTVRHINNSVPKRNLSFTGTNVILSVEPTHTWEELEGISRNVHKLASRLQQMREEQRKSERESSALFAQKRNERDSLILQLENLRKVKPKKTQTDELLRRIAAKQYT